MLKRSQMDDSHDELQLQVAMLLALHVAASPG